MGAKISLPANYATDFKELKSDLLKRYNWKNIEHSVLEHSSVGFLCRVKATNARKQELTRVVKAIYVNTNEFNLDLDKIIIDSDCRNLVKIHDIVTVDDKVYCGYVVMESCKESVENKKLSEGEVWQMLGDILTGLKVLHDAGFVHRDVKPANILIREIDGRRQYVLADFGISRKVANNMTAGAGTFYFMAPEVENTTNYSYSSDMFSLGLTGLCLLTGSLVIPRNSTNIAEAIEKANCSQAMKDFLRQLLQNEPENRPSVDDALETVNTVHSELVVLMNELMEYGSMIQRIHDQSSEVQEIHEAILSGIAGQIEAFVWDMRQYVSQSRLYNSRLPQIDDELAAHIHILVDSIISDAQIFDSALTAYVDLIDQPNNNLLAIKRELTDKLNESQNVAMLTGTGAGIAVGSGVTATMVAVPSTMFGAAGAFVIAGAAFPPVLVILGGAAVLAGIGLGLAVLIKSAIRTGNKKLLHTVTQLIAAIAKIKSLIATLKVHMLKVKSQLDLASSRPRGPAPINPASINAINRFAPEITATVRQLKDVTIPDVPRECAPSLLLQ